MQAGPPGIVILHPHSRWRITIRQDPLGTRACIIGEAVSDHSGTVVMETEIGGWRIVDMLTGEQFPWIC